MGLVTTGTTSGGLQVAMHRNCHLFSYYYYYYYYYYYTPWSTISPCIITDKATCS